MVWGGGWGGEEKEGNEENKQTENTRKHGKDMAKRSKTEETQGGRRKTNSTKGKQGELRKTKEKIGKLGKPRGNNIRNLTPPLGWLFLVVAKGATLGGPPGSTSYARAKFWQQRLNRDQASTSPPGEKPETGIIDGPLITTNRHVWPMAMGTLRDPK